MKKEIKLYNVLFPLWMLMLFPITWLIILPGNFIIDSIVLIICMFALKFENKKQMYKSCTFGRCNRFSVLVGDDVCI